MVKWRCADGTTVDVDGNVTGTGELADDIRVVLEAIDSGRVMMVGMWPQPGGGAELRRGDAPTMDVMVRGMARTRGVVVVAAPDVEYPPDPRGELDPPEPGALN